MRFPAADLTTPEVLWRIRSDDKFLEEVAGQLLEVAEISKPILDQLAKEK
jgi:hypothetical protein